MFFWSKKPREDNVRARIGNINIDDVYIHLANIIKIFIEDYGFKKSCDLEMPVDKNGNPIPLYTYPAIEYLNNFNFENKKIFEFGSGNSSLFWLTKNADVTSVENNQEWVDKLENKLRNYSNHHYIISKNKEDYINSILNFDDQYFDIIIIDGGENRYLCAENSIKKIKSNGLIILDNSDWYPNTAAFLKEKLNFIQIDFYGFRPSKHNTSVTSIFFSRDFNFKISGLKQPNYALGGFEHHSSWDSKNS